MVKLTCVMLVLTLLYGKAYATVTETKGLMLVLTIGHADAYVTVWSSLRYRNGSVRALFTFCSHRGTHREQTVNKQRTRGTDREQTVNIGGRWGWRHPPLLGEARVRIRMHISRTYQNSPKNLSPALFTSHANHPMCVSLMRRRGSRHATICR